MGVLAGGGQLVGGRTDGAPGDSGGGLSKLLGHRRLYDGVCGADAVAQGGPGLPVWQRVQGGYSGV